MIASYEAAGLTLVNANFVRSATFGGGSLSFTSNLRRASKDTHSLERVDALRPGTCLPLLSALIWSPVLAQADDAICEGANVSVTAPTLPLAHSVCDSVEETLSLLGQCDLALSDRVKITILDDLPNVSHACFGFYECDSNRILIRSPESIARVSGQSALYVGLDANTVFDSIVSHEVSHAAFAQSACRDAECLANHEYVAYVMQMWSLPPAIRGEIVERFGQVEPVDPMRINELIAVMAPAKFAALAWQHFNEDGNGCDFIQDLATGRVSLEIVWE